MAKEKSSWSWGGAMFSLLYLALSRRIVPAVLLTIALFVPFLNFVVMIVLFIWGGLKGRNWLAADETLSDQQRENYIDFFDRVGLYLFWVGVIFFVVWLLFLILGIGGGLMMMGQDGGQSAEFMQMMQGMENLEQLEQLEQMETGQ